MLPWSVPLPRQYVFHLFSFPPSFPPVSTVSHPFNFLSHSSINHPKFWWNSEILINHSVQGNPKNICAYPPNQWIWATSDSGHGPSLSMESMFVGTSQDQTGENREMIDRWMVKMCLVNNIWSQLVGPINCTDTSSDIKGRRWRIEPGMVYYPILNGAKEISLLS